MRLWGSFHAVAGLFFILFHPFWEGSLVVNRAANSGLHAVRSAGLGLCDGGLFFHLRSDAFHLMERAALSQSWRAVGEVETKG